MNTLDDSLVKRIKRQGHQSRSYFCSSRGNESPLYTYVWKGNVELHKLHPTHTVSGLTNTGIVMWCAFLAHPEYQEFLTMHPDVIKLLVECGNPGAIVCQPLVEFAWKEKNDGSK